MFEYTLPASEVDELLLNVELRSELEPYYDESISLVISRQFSLKFENEFLACMLEWETAPILPIYQWFEPELRLPQPGSLTPEELRSVLCDVVQKLYQKKIVLDFTDHLSDLELYRIIYRSILPSREKKLKNRNDFIHWDCSHTGGDPTIWLIYYASNEERQAWTEVNRQSLPPKRVPTYHRDFPVDPLWNNLID